MVSLTEVRTHNSTLKFYAPGLVAVFVGGTSGIGLYAAREFVRNTAAPHVYLVGRSQAEATRIIDEFRELNPSSQTSFIQKDVSLLRNVDEACDEIRAKEARLNLLFMTCGYLTFKGRDETAEGLDRKLALHYYSRMRFIQNLAPLLNAAADNPEPRANLSRVVSVLDPRLGLKTLPNFSDLSLRTTFSLRNCANHASVMANYTLTHYSKLHPGTSFIHAYPSGVDTNVSRDAYGRFNNVLWKISTTILKPLFVEKQESGERHLWAATAGRYAPRAKAEEVDAVKGFDGIKGSGAYGLNWDGEVFQQSVEDEGAEEKISGHLEEVFKKVCEEGGKY